jgi:transforming growth factor-beta-induced protein
MTSKFAKALFLSTALAFTGATATALAPVTAIAQESPMVGGAPMFATKNIVENAVNSADHTTLVAAVKAAGLVETLSGEGPFTVFAPTNAAFDKLPDGTVETLLKPENKDQLTKILTCHVVAANAMSDAIMGMIADDNGEHPVKTVGGCTFTAKMSGDNIVIVDGQGNEATVTIADVKQSNGVIHVIDTVLLPAADDGMESDSAAMDDSGDGYMADDTMAESAMADEETVTVGGAPMYPSKTIVENAVNSADHTTLVAAVKAAGLVETLSGEGPFTVFAPTNAAFDKLPDGTVETLLKPENKDQLTKVLTAHVVAGDLSAEELMRRARNHGGRYNFNAVSGDALTAVIKGRSLYIFDEAGGAGKVTISNVNQSNGVIHVVDDVLLPS